MAEDDDLRAAFGTPAPSPEAAPAAAPADDDLRSAFGRGSGVPEITIRPPSVRESARERGRSQGSGGILDRIAAPFMATGQSIGNAMYGNLMDYPVAVAYGLSGMVRGRGFGQPYSDALEDIRGYRQGLLESRPIENFGGAMVGAIPSAVVGSRAITAAQALPGLGRGAWNGLGSVGQSAAVNAGLAGAQGFAEGEGLEDRTRRGLQGAALGAGTGAFAEGLIRGGAGTIRGMVGADPTPAAGVSPQANLDIFRREGVQPTMGQLTGGLAQQQFEERARHGAYGRGAQQIMEQHALRQQEALRARQAQLVDDMGGRALPGQDIQTGLREVADRYRQLGGIGYDSLDSAPAGVTMTGVQTLRDMPGQVLERIGVTSDPQMIQRLPETERAIGMINRFMQGVDDSFAAIPSSARPGVAGGNQLVDGPQMATPTIPFSKLNELRKALNSQEIFGRTDTSTADGRALAALRRGYLDWLDRTAQSPEFRGATDVMQTLRRANQDWGRYLDMTHGNPRAPDADARNVVARLIQRDMTAPEQTALVASNTGAGTAGRASRTQPHLEGILGRDYPGVADMRTSYVEGALFPNRRGAPESPSPQRQTSELAHAFDRTGAPLARNMFSPEELATVGEHQSLLRLMTPRAEATNPSRTAWQKMAERASTMPLLSGAVGGAGAAIGSPYLMGMAALPYLYTGAGTLRARAAVNPNLGPMDLGGARIGGNLAGAGAREILQMLQD